MEPTNVTGTVPKALAMIFNKKQRPKEVTPDRISNRVLRLAGHNGHRLRGTARPARPA